MFMKVGNTHIISLLVTDINGSRVTNDSPYTVIKNISKNIYWNGIAWGDSEFRIYLEHVVNGVYQYIFAPDSADIYEINTKSDEYNISKTETVETYDEDFVSYNWLTNNEFIVKYSLGEDTTTPDIKVCKGKDNTFWDGQGWSLEPVFISMNVIGTEVATYNFVPNEDGDYYITIVDYGHETLIVLRASSTGDSIPPVVVNNMSMKSLDGTDSTILTETGTSLPSVKISVYDLVTKELVSQAGSDIDGGWSMVLKPGKYYFVFEKDGYVPIGMQRVVM